MKYILSPQIPVNLEKIEAVAAADDAIFKEGVCRANMAAQKAQRVTFRQMVFKNAVFREVAFGSPDIGDVRFEGCDLSNASFDSAVIYRAEFSGCQAHRV